MGILDRELGCKWPTAQGLKGAVGFSANVKYVTLNKGRRGDLQDQGEAEDS